MNMKLSIITINFNNLEGLKKTAESVINQTWKEFEWIIIDGGSTDGSKEYIVNRNDDLNRNGWNIVICIFCIPGFYAGKSVFQLRYGNITLHRF